MQTLHTTLFTQLNYLPYIGNLPGSEEGEINCILLLAWLRVETSITQPRSTQPPVAPAASRLQHGRRRNANALRERGHIELIEPILAIITVEK